MIAPIGGDYQMIPTPQTNEVVAYAAHGGTWVNLTLGKAIRTGRDGITPCDTGMSVRSKTAPYPVLIVSTTISPACELRGSLQVGKKQQCTSPDEVRNEKKLDTFVDGKSPNYRDSASVFSKVIGRELSHGYSNDLYLCCGMNLLSNVVQTEAPKFVDFGLPAIITSNELSVLGNNATSI